MKKLAGLLCVLSLLFVTGCATVADSGVTTDLGVGAGFGLLYTDMEFSASSRHYIDSNGIKVGSKTGESSRKSVLGLVSWGDSSIPAAAKKGGIKTVNTVNYRVMSVLLGIFTESTTVVTGE